MNQASSKGYAENYDSICDYAQRIYSLAAVLDRPDKILLSDISSLILIVADRGDKQMTKDEWQEMSTMLANIIKWATRYQP